MGPHALSVPRCRPKNSSGKTIPAVDHVLIDDQDVATKGDDPGLRPVGVGFGLDRWASAATFRGSDKRVAPTAPAFAWRRKGLAGESADQLAKVLGILEGIQQAFNEAQTGARRSRWRI